MQQLIFKDVYTQKVYTYFINLIWFIVFTGFFTDGTPIRHILLLAFLPAWLAFSSNGNTKSFEKESAFLISLPIERKDIVLAKYVGGFMWFGLSVPAVLSYVFLFDKFAPFPTRMMHIDEVILACSVFVILLSVFYPILFRGGYLVATVVAIILTVFALMTMQMSFNMLENPRLVDFHNFVDQLIANKLIVTVVFAIVSLICLVFSYLLSVRVFNKRDL